MPRGVTGALGTYRRVGAVDAPGLVRPCRSVMVERRLLDDPVLGRVVPELRPLEFRWVALL